MISVPGLAEDIDQAMDEGPEFLAELFYENPDMFTDLGKYIIELEVYQEKYYTLEERLEIERQAHDEAIKKADETILSLEDENQALREQINILEEDKKRSDLFRDIKIAGGGATIAALIVALTSL